MGGSPGQAPQIKTFSTATELSPQTPQVAIAIAGGRPSPLEAVARPLGRLEAKKVFVHPEFRLHRAVRRLEPKKAELAVRRSTVARLKAGKEEGSSPMCFTEQ